jgi:N-ethylmaleimide reductase
MKTARTIVLTGAAGGMGAEFVKRSLDNGDTVIATDSSDEALENLSSKLANAQLLTRSADITREQDTEDLVAFAKERSGHIDVPTSSPARPSSSMAATKCSEQKDLPMTDLFSPLRIGTLDLPNRILMSAMTRTRATDDDVPTEVMAEYFAQRAGAGLIVTDCTAVSAQARGVIHGPGIWRKDQIAGWRKVVDRVHRAGGHIFCQIWHCGRVAHPDMRGGDVPVAPSPIPAIGDFFLPSGRVDFPVPRELDIEEIPGIIHDFAQATRNARAAGFDGVELHGANGYLQDQFLQDGSNKRTDSYGGSAENRARLMIETTQAMLDAWDAAHVGVRLSPSSYLYGVDDSDKRETFGVVIDRLNALGIAYLTLLEPNAKDAGNGVQIERVADTFRSKVTVALIVNTGFDKAKGNSFIAERKADAVTFGVPYIANPDLVARFRTDAPLNKPDPSTFYGEGAKGYTDYPALDAPRGATA